MSRPLFISEVLSVFIQETKRAILLPTTGREENYLSGKVIRHLSCDSLTHTHSDGELVAWVQIFFYSFL